MRRELDEARQENSRLRQQISSDTGESHFLRTSLQEVQRGFELSGQQYNESLRSLGRERDDWQTRAEEAEYELSLQQEKTRLHETLLKPRLELQAAWREKLACCPEKRRLERALERNIARELCIAREGRVLEKVTEKAGKSEVRLVTVDDHEGVLRWQHAPASSLMSGKGKSLELESVLRIDYGCHGRASVLYPTVPLWLCFSLTTAERAFDFICPDEDVAQCFVLSLSRLCKHAEGGIHFRRQFIARKGWSKIKDSSLRRRVPLSSIVVETMRRLCDCQTAGPHSSSEDIAARVEVVSTSSSPAPLATVRASPNSAAMDTYGSGANKRAWPKVGETWLFTGAVDAVDLYKDSDLKQWVNQLKCRGKNHERVKVTIESSREGQRNVEIRGTDKFRFVKGWLQLCDDRGVWAIERA